MAIQGYQWAAGWDATGSFQNVEDDLPTYDGGYPVLVQGRGMYSPGTIKVRADKLREVVGFASFTWLLAALTVAQYDHIQSNYTTGGNSYSGAVTVRTRSNDDSYANFNAVLYLPPQSELERIPGSDVFANVELTFVVQEAL